MKKNPANTRTRVIAGLFALLLLGLPFVAGCSSTPEDKDAGSLNGKTTDGKPVPPEARTAPAAPGGLEAPPGAKGMKGGLKKGP